MDFKKPLDFVQILAEDVDLSPYMDEDDLENLGRKCFEDYQADEDSRSEYMKTNEQAMNLALQISEEKSFPWPNASNVKYPLITIAAMQFSSRAYASLIPNQRPVKGKVVGYDPDGTKLERANRIGKHMSYQILDEMEEWEEDMDRLCMIVPIIGCAFKKTYYDPIRERNRSELVLTKNLVVDYYTSSLEDANRISHVLEYSKNDILERQAKDIFRDCGLPIKDTTSNLDASRNELNEELTGTPANGVLDDRPFEFIEQQRWIDLDGDGYDEPYIVVVSADNQKVYRIVKNFSSEQVEYGDTGQVIRITSNKYFTKFPFIPNPDGGFYDIGFGVLLGPTNETVNTLINQLVDAGTLSNMQSGFLGRGIRFKKGSMSFSPGEWKQVNNTGDDIRKSIIPLPVREPSGVLFNLLGLLKDAGQQISSVSDMMMGQSPGQNQPATTSMAVLEQGLQVYSSIYKRLYRALTKEFKKLYKLNATYLPYRTYFQVLGTDEQQGAQISVLDYDPESIAVVPSADPNVASEAQKLMKAQGLMELVGMGTINPMEATKRVLEAQEQPNIEALMQMPEPQPNPEVQLEAEKLLMEREKLDVEKAKAQDESEREWAKLLIEMENSEDKMSVERLKTMLDAVGKEDQRNLDMLQKREERNERNETRNSQLAAEPGNPAIS